MLSTAPAPLPQMGLSSLEEMLYSLRRREEKPKDVPPALPTRPVSKGRLPSSRRSLPVNLKASNKTGEGVVRKFLFYGYDPRSVAAAPLVDDTDTVGRRKSHSEKIHQLEYSRNEALQGIVGLQKHFRGLQSRRYFQQLKRGSVTLQSFIRGEKARNEFDLMARSRAILTIQRYARRRIAQNAFVDRKRAAVCIQSVVRGWLARKHFLFLLDTEITKRKHAIYSHVLPNGTLEVKVHGSNKEYIQVHPLVLAELQSRVLKAEEALKQREESDYPLRSRVLKAEEALQQNEEEKNLLKEQLQTYQTKWNKYETRMKSMEETWQKQMNALQMSLAAAKRSLAADDSSQKGKFDFATSPLYYDSEDTALHTPECIPNKTHHLPESEPNMISNGGDHHVVNHIVKEFEQKKQVFEDDVRFIVEVKTGKLDTGMNPDEELHRLKLRFKFWKREYRARLKEANTALHKFSKSEAMKPKKKWWGKTITSCLAKS